MGKKQLSKSEKKELNQKLNEAFGIQEFFTKKDKVELEDLPDAKHMLFLRRDDEPVFFYLEQRIIPHLKLLLKQDILKSIIIDMGAVKHVTNGADIMRPGIVDTDKTIKKGDLIVIRDQQHKKALAVGEALLSGDEILHAKEGKMIRNLHWVGDKIWQATTK